jgi:hypothetical protein
MTPRETITQLNLERDEELARRASLTRDEMFDELLDLFELHIEAKDARSESEIKESIFQFLKDTKEVSLDYDLLTNYNPYQ